MAQIELKYGGKDRELPSFCHLRMGEIFLSKDRPYIKTGDNSATDLWAGLPTSFNPSATVVPTKSATLTVEL